MEVFQTLREFIDNPFGNGNPTKQKELENKYQAMKKNRDFRVRGYTTVDDNYLIHVTLPSDTVKDQIYDVVVLFFTDENTVKKRTTFSNYYVKFFSNSPSFIYRYAYVYKKMGFLIDFLFDKLDSNYADQAPAKTNANMDLYYDKSIYCACRLLLDDELISLSKTGIILKHKKSNQAFFRDIKSFQNIKLTSELNNMDKKINKELEENKRIRKSKKKEENNDNKKHGNRIKSKSNTLGKNSPSAIRRVKKKSGGKKSSTRKHT